MHHELATGGVGAPEAVVDPFPHEAAAEPVGRLEDALVVDERSGSVAHRVGVLAEEEREAASAYIVRRPGDDAGRGRLLASTDGLQQLLVRVHEAGEVGVPVRRIALVHDGPGRVALPDPLLEYVEVLADPALVRHRPHDDRGMVLVALDHPLDAVEHRIPPDRLGRRVAGPVGVDEPVGLQVALLDHPEPQLVAEAQEVGVRRVVAGAHGVEVVLLHQQDVLPHRLRVERAAAVLVVLVAVHAAEQDGHAVHEQPAVLDRDRAEADPQLDGLGDAGRFVGRPRSEPGRVEARLLGAPRLDGQRGRRAGREVADAQLRDVDEARDVGVHAEHADAVPVVVSRRDLDVVDRSLRAFEEVDVAEDPGQPPHVLVFEVGAARPPVHAHGEDVVAGHEVLADLVLDGEPTALAVPEEHAVQPDRAAGVDALEAQHGVVVPPTLRQGEVAPVVTRRVLLRDVRRIDRDRERGVRVQRLAVALEDPVCRDADAVPAGVVEVWIAERVARAVRRRCERERPLAVQRQPARVAPFVGSGSPPPGPGDRVFHPRRRESC